MWIRRPTPRSPNGPPSVAEPFGPHLVGHGPVARLPGGGCAGPVDRRVVVVAASGDSQAGPADPARVHRLRRDPGVASVVGGARRRVPVRCRPGDDGDARRHRGGPVPRSDGGAPVGDGPHVGGRGHRVGCAVSDVPAEHGSGADAGGQRRPRCRIRGVDGHRVGFDGRPRPATSSWRGRRSVRPGGCRAQPAGRARGWWSTPMASANGAASTGHVASTTTGQKETFCASATAPGTTSRLGAATARPSVCTASP